MFRTMEAHERVDPFHLCRWAVFTRVWGLRATNPCIETNLDTSAVLERRQAKDVGLHCIARTAMWSSEFNLGSVNG